MVRALSWRFWTPASARGRGSAPGRRGEAELVEGDQGHPEVLASPDLFAQSKPAPDPRAEEEKGEDGRRDRHGGLVPPGPASRPRWGGGAVGRGSGGRRGTVGGRRRLRRRAIAIVDLLGHRRGEDRFQVSRDRRVEPPGGDWLVAGDLAEQLLAVVAVEGGLEGRQLVEGRPEAVDVGPRVDLRRPLACSGLR